MATAEMFYKNLYEHNL